MERIREDGETEERIFEIEKVVNLGKQRPEKSRKRVRKVTIIEMRERRIWGTYGKKRRQ